MTQTFDLPYDLPDLNTMIASAKSHFAAYSKLKSSATTLVSVLAKLHLQPIRTRSFLAFEWRATSRKKDPDNLAAGKKVILDGLVQAGILPDDGWRWIVGFSDTFVVDKESPGVRVVITECEGGNDGYQPGKPYPQEIRINDGCA